MTPQAKTLYEAILAVLSRRTMQHTVDKDGYPLRLVDMLCMPGEKSLNTGLDEIIHICEEIFSDPAVNAALASTQQEVPVSLATNDDLLLLWRKWFGHRDTMHLTFVQAVDQVMESMLAEELPTQQEAEPAPISRMAATAPERIWLNIFTDGSLESDEFPADHEGITWCEDEVGDADVQYVRADLAAPSNSVEFGGIKTDALASSTSRVPLTDGRLHAIWSNLGGFTKNHSFHTIARAIEAAHGITAPNPTGEQP